MSIFKRSDYFWGMIYSTKRIYKGEEGRKVQAFFIVVSPLMPAAILGWVIADMIINLEG